MMITLFGGEANVHGEGVSAPLSTLLAATGR
jgi:hypothetical protein